MSETKIFNKLCPYTDRNEFFNILGIGLRTNPRSISTRIYKIVINSSLEEFITILINDTKLRLNLSRLYKTDTIEEITEIFNLGSHVVIHDGPVVQEAPDWFLKTIQ